MTSGTTNPRSPKRLVELNDRHWSIEELLAVADGTTALTLSSQSAWRDKITAGAAYLAALLEAGEAV